VHLDRGFWRRQVLALGTAAILFGYKGTRAVPAWPAACQEGRGSRPVIIGSRRCLPSRHEAGGDAHCLRHASRISPSRSPTSMPIPAWASSLRD
jgi:hypothetical protein